MRLFLLWCATILISVYSCTTPKCQEYQRLRDELVREADALSFDANTKLSPAEQEVDAILSQLRAELATDYDTTEQYYSQRDTVENSSLFHALQAMPKGAILHVHALGFADSALSALNRSDCWVSFSEELLPAGFELKFIDPGPPPTKAPGGSVPGLRNATKGLPNATMAVAWERCLDQANGFAEKVAQAMLFRTPPDTVSKTEMWELFDATIILASTPLMYAPHWEEVACEVLQDWARDGVQHIELRQNFEGAFQSSNGTSLPVDFTIDTYLANVATCQNQSQSQNQSLLSISFIMCNNRGSNFDVIKAGLAETVRLQKKYGEKLILGYDVDDEEDRLHPLSYYMPTFVEQSESLKYFFHAGETTRNLHSIDNVFSALALNTSRIGHGFALREFPTLQAEMRKRHTGLEICPLSNQILRLVPDLADHPMVGFSAAGIPVSISPDDPLIYGTKGATADWTTSTTAMNLTLSWLKQACSESLTTAVGPANQPEARGLWEQDWEDWIAWMLREFSI